uniref:Uncharacterized protein n=1 Tax=Anguilla anguilla TaxID=7936 RepID=A0A0E9UWY0_ANGAN
MMSRPGPEMIQNAPRLYLWHAKFTVRIYLFLATAPDDSFHIDVKLAVRSVHRVKLSHPDKTPMFHAPPLAS